MLLALNVQQVEYTLYPSQYVVLFDKVRREKTYVQFRISGGAKGYDKDILVNGVNIYSLPVSQYAMSQLQDSLLIKDQTWQNLYAGIRITLLSISSKVAKIRISPSVSMTLLMNNDYVPV